METSRVFIGVDIGDNIREHLDQLQRKLKKVHANIRWVKPRNIHLTLAFLGDLPLEQVTAVERMLDQTCNGHAAFDLEACGCGFFGKRSHPRVIWAGVCDCPPLTELQNRVARRLNDAVIGFDKKPFSPHLTLGRIKGIDRHIEPLLEKIASYQHTKLGSTHVDCVELIQSTLTPRGAEYEVLHRAVLQKRSVSPKPGGNGTLSPRED